MTKVQYYFYQWRDNGLWQSINHALLMLAHEAIGREASPTAGVIDSQSVKRKVAALAATTRERRSRVESATSSPTPKGSWSERSFTLPTSRIATAHQMSCAAFATASLAAPYLRR